MRLGIISVLMSRAEATFSDLKTILGVTQGNLGLHLQKLEEAGYVEIEKAFVKRRPRTTARISDAGRAAFLAHVEHLSGIASGDVELAEPPEEDDESRPGDTSED